MLLQAKVGWNGTKTGILTVPGAFSVDPSGNWVWRFGCCTPNLLLRRGSGTRWERCCVLLVQRTKGRFDRMLGGHGSRDTGHGSCVGHVETAAQAAQPQAARSSYKNGLGSGLAAPVPHTLRPYLGMALVTPHPTPRPLAMVECEGPEETDPRTRSLRNRAEARAIVDVLQCYRRLYGVDVARRCCVITFYAAQVLGAGRGSPS